jgi:hypothetical protein
VPTPGQPEQDRCVEGVHGRPALGAVAGVTGHSGAARLVGQQADESALALVVHGARRSKPSWYLIATKDHMIPPSA